MSCFKPFCFLPILLSQNKIDMILKRSLLAGMLMVAMATVSANAQDGAPKPKKNPQEMFKKLDANADGKLSKQEVESVKDGKSKLAQNFAVIDTNKDGFLEPAELKEFRKKNKPNK